MPTAAKDDQKHYGSQRATRWDFRDSKDGNGRLMPTAAKGDQKLYEQHVAIFRDSKDGNERRIPTAAKGDHKLCGSPQHVGISKTVIIRTHDLQCFVVVLFHFPVTFYRTRARPVRAVALSVIG